LQKSTHAANKLIQLCSSEMLDAAEQMFAKQSELHNDVERNFFISQDEDWFPSFDEMH